MFYCISDEIEILSLEKMMSRVICNKCSKDGQEAQLISKMFLFMIVKMQDCDFYLEMKLYLSVLRNSPHLIHYTLHITSEARHDNWISPAIQTSN